MIVEVRENTLAIERQTAIDRVASFTSPFFDSELPNVLAKIKAVDKQSEDHINGFMEVYGLTYREAAMWDRHLWLVWETLEAGFLFNGASEELVNQISALLVTRDNQIYLDSVLPYRFSLEFREHIIELQDGLEQWLKT